MLVFVFCQHFKYFTLFSSNFHEARPEVLCQKRNSFPSYVQEVTFPSEIFQDFFLSPRVASVQMWYGHVEEIFCVYAFIEWLSEREFEQTLGVSRGWRSLECWAHRVPKSQTRLINWTTTTEILIFIIVSLFWIS